MGKELSIAILAIAVVGLLHSTAAVEIHVVGDKIGWVVPPGGQYAYESWASVHHFAVGDILGTLHIYSSFIMFSNFKLK